MSPSFGACTACVRRFRWPRSISIQLSPMCFASFCLPGWVFALLVCWPCRISISILVISLLLLPWFGACTAGIRPFPLATQHFYSCVLPGHFFTFFPTQDTVRGSQCFLRVSALLRDNSLLISLLVGHCVRLVSLSFPFVSLLVPLFVGHCPPCLPSYLPCLKNSVLGMLLCCPTGLVSTVV